MKRTVPLIAATALVAAVSIPAFAAPPRAGLCEDLTGDALTRCLYSDLDDRLRKLEPTPTPTPTPTPSASVTPTPTPTSEPSPTPSPSAPAFTVSVTEVTTSSAKVNWPEYSGATSYTVGRNGNDSLNSGPWSTTDPATARSRVFDKLLPDTEYVFTVKPSNGAAVSVTQRTAKAATPTPSVTPTPTPTVTPTPTPTATTTTPVSGRNLPLVGKSAMGFNDLVFHENSTDPTEFVNWRKRDVDGTMSFASRGSWSALQQVPTSRRAGDILVWSTPFGPEGQGVTNASIAAGTHNANIRAIATKMVAAGMNTDRTVIRLAWEGNGDWYEWSQERGGSGAYAAAYQQWVTQARAAGLTQARFSWNLNKGSMGGAAWAGYPGDGYVDIIGLDSYDMWNPVRVEADWPSYRGTDPGLDSVAAFARSHNKQMAIEEWGVVNGETGNAGAGDNPFYVAKMASWILANKSILAYDVTYDDKGAPSTWAHDYSYGRNPRAGAEYLKTWGGPGAPGPLSS